MELTREQKQFFETFGFLSLPGLLKEEVGWIIDEFEAVFRGRNVVHDGSERSCIVPFIDQSTRLSTLLDDPRLVGLISGILGEEFNYLGGDGNYYTGDTSWHSDGFHTVGKYLKVALYLDGVGRDSGCLRVIPGTHRLDMFKGWEARQAGESPERWGIEQKDVPAVALETRPGDVVAFNHNLMHASFGGSKRRRMFTLNSCARCETEPELDELKKYIANHHRYWIDQMHSDIMRGTASQARMRHLQQVIDNEGHLPALSARARKEMSEPARG
ncbi:MAG: phytanoyl-CoA dioxygenase family protein [Caldilineaceae bacterium]|nr:phytanoyl-CoA dioxygenase family protein [Caldilineaceae bacterium]